MIGRKRLLWSVVAMAANASCWALFLVLEPVATERLAELRAQEQRGQVVLSSAAPILVAERAVSTHVLDSVYVYSILSLPGVAAGAYLGGELPFWFPEWSYRGEPVWRSPASRSWALAGGLLFGTGLWWGAVGFTIGHVSKRRHTSAGAGMHAR